MMLIKGYLIFLESFPKDKLFVVVKDKNILTQAVNMGNNGDFILSCYLNNQY